MAKNKKLTIQAISPKVKVDNRTEELWEELKMDQDADASAVKDVLEHEKHESRHPWLVKIFWLVALLVVGFGLVNFQYFSAWVGFWLFKPQTYTTEKPETNTQNLVRGEPNSLEIASLGIKTPLQYAESKNETEFQELLQKGVVHYPGTALVGEVGNAYFFGHSSDYAWSKGGYKTVFALLPNIAVGEEIKISGQDGIVYTYKVTEKFVASKTDLGLLSQETGGKKILTLQTSYPVGTALKRYIVKAELAY